MPNDGPTRKSPNKKKMPLRQHTIPSSAYPSPMINADITCIHNGLATNTSGIKTKRRAISSKMWFFLRKFFPYGPEFKCSIDAECVICSSGVKEAKAVESEKKELAMMERRAFMIPDALAALVARKSGVPMHCVTSRVAFYNEMGDDSTPEADAFDPLSGDGPSAADLHAIDQALMMDGEGMLQQPLVPGLYNLVPRRWLKAWRHYLKDSSASFLPHLDCAAFLCQPHGLLVMPPHVEEYLIGLRRSLLTGLGAYPGEVAEIVSADEWDAMQDVFHGAADFSLRFCLDGEGVSWNTGVCMRCDPFAYHPLLPSANKKKTRNGQQVGGLVV